MAAGLAGHWAFGLTVVVILVGAFATMGALANGRIAGLTAWGNTGGLFAAGISAFGVGFGGGAGTALFSGSSCSST